METFRVPTAGFRLSEQDPANSHSLDPERQQSVLDHNRRRIAELQNVLYAESEQSLLLILQSMDTGGKDPIIRDVLNLTNPQACRAVAFKKAGGVEEKHDMFWRFHRAAPERGEIVVFNRSWYDTMIASRAHGEIDENELAAVCRQICAFESVLADQRISIVKVFLHISKDEQRKRLQERIDDPHRHWELSEADFSERKFWDGYARAYDEVITATNTDQCPWYIIPADDRHYRDAAASVIIAGALEALNPQYPPAKFDVSSIEWE
ncbi:MAG TPA: PPK2 family polyphosphate kinase [Bryobacteraceae bacterium]|nr:PPK2 family polyphosphate kinase [Bryobacteraceae bacterium]